MWIKHSFFNQILIGQKWYSAKFTVFSLILEWGFVLLSKADPLGEFFVKMASNVNNEFHYNVDDFVKYH